MKELTLTFKDFENCCRYYNKDNIYRNLNQICFDPNYYDIVQTFFDDYFYIRIYSKDNNSAKELKQYFKDSGYYVYGEVEQYGRTKMNAYFDNEEYRKHVPEGYGVRELTQTQINEFKMTYDEMFPKPGSEIGVDDIGTFFTMVPISKSKNVYTFIDFLEQEENYLIDYAKKNVMPIMLLMCHIDNVIHGEFIICDKEITGLETDSGFVELTIEAMFHNARTMYISACILKQFSDDNDKFIKSGCKIVYSQIKFQNLENAKFHKIKKFLE